MLGEALGGWLVACQRASSLPRSLTRPHSVDRAPSRTVFGSRLARFLQVTPDITSIGFQRCYGLDCGSSTVPTYVSSQPFRTRRKPSSDLCQLGSRNRNAGHLVKVITTTTTATATTTATGSSSSSASTRAKTGNFCSTSFIFLFFF